MKIELPRCSKEVLIKCYVALSAGHRLVFTFIVKIHIKLSKSYVTVLKSALFFEWRVSFNERKKGFLPISLVSHSRPIVLKERAPSVNFYLACIHK